MTRSSAATVENNFINGFVTEATALNFPEAAATDTDNCVFNVDGSFERRQGIDYETDYTTVSVVRDGCAVSTYLWQAANGDGDKNLVVTQTGLILRFYLIGQSSLSAGLVVDTIDLTPFLTDTTVNPESMECQFASGKGYLFVTHKYMEPIYVEYDGTTVTATEITIQIRDLDGVDDGLANDNRPSTLSDLHKYNLYNQGWAPFETGGLNDPRATGVGGSDLPPTGYLAGDPLSTWDSNRTDFPSNADVWWLYKSANELFQPKLASALTRGNSPAPKGHYVVDAFNIDRSAVVNSTVDTGAGSVSFSIAGLATETSGNIRPKCCAFYAGRVWYSGVDALGYSNKIYFSQIITVGSDKFGACHALNDPTSEQSFDTLATDGGTVQILDCGTIIKMVALHTNLVIFATNGIWTISGSTGIGFTPTDMSINKISSQPNLSQNSFVDVAGLPAWWTTDGIYIISQSNQVGGVTATSLTEKKIKRFFINEVPTECKRYAVGSFNPLTKVIQWFYRSTPAGSITQRYEYDSVLCFNTVTQAFYKWSISNPVVFFNGVTCVRGNTSTTDTETVTSGGLDVTVDGVDIIFTYTGTDTETAGVFKYLISRSAGASYNQTFAEEYDERLIDFYTLDSVGVNYESYIISGYRLRGEAQKKFQSNYIFLYLDTLGTNVCHFGAIWDYANLPETGDFTTRQLIDTTSVTGRNYKHKKLKVRGSGLSVQFMIQSLPGERFKIVGWSTFDTGNTTV